MTARSLMLQGCSSDAGKSVLTAAFCRIFLQDGLRVAPFKAQNMSNQSGVDRQGGELGRAQIVQAQACRIPPDVRMNPVLLKPMSDTGVQVILRGRPVGAHDVAGYIDYKSTAFPVATACYDELAAEFDVVVLEGAGSAGEMNLKHHDIVNMGFARHSRSPVLLVGDIDRGGVYASFVGHYEVMDGWERDLLRGFLVNKFRGDQSLLAPAHDYVAQRTGKPVVGVVPWLHELGLPEEDRVALANTIDPGRAIDLAVVRLQHASNTSDFDALRTEADVSVRLVSRAGELGSPDCLILPGSRNTIGDLQALRDSGLADAITRLAHGGRAVLVGLCGGFQMLGERIDDPLTVEAGGSCAGLGLLPITTSLARDKVLRQVEARHVATGLALRGYEIHHGLSAYGAAAPCVVDGVGDPIGVQSADGRIWGTYLHGAFDADDFRRAFIDGLRLRKGLAPLGASLSRYDLEAAFDRLAATVRASVDLPAIYRMMGM